MDATRFQYQSKAEPVLATAAVPALTWQPEHVDAVTPKAGLSAAILSGAVFCVFVGVSEASAVYPNRIDRPARSAEYQFVAHSLQPELPIAHAWEATYPDRIDRAPSVHPSAVPFYRSGSSVIPLGHVGWIGQYPDLVWRTTLPVGAIPTFSARTDPPPVIVTALSWQGHFTDRTDRRTWPAALHPFLVQDRITFVTAAEQAWSPWYPDLLTRVSLHPSRLALSPWAPLGDSLPPEPRWKAIYPDLLNRAVWRRPEPAQPPLFATTVGLFGWRGVYPERLDRVVFPASQQQATVLSPHATIPIPDPRWLSHYPDRIDRLAGLTTATQTGFAQNISPITNPPTPDLAWDFDHVQPIPGLLPPLQRHTVLEPIRPFTPELSWRGWQPEAIRRVFLPTALQMGGIFQRPTVAPDIQLRWFRQATDQFRAIRRTPDVSVRPLRVAVSPVEWRAANLDLPGRRVRPAWLLPQSVSGPGALIIIGARQGWKPTYPDILWAKSSVSMLAGLPPRTDPILPPGSDAGCTIFNDEFVIAPTLEPDFLMASTLADEFVIVPSLASEEYC